MAVPSIKGTAFQSVVEDLLRLREAGRLSPDDLELRLARVTRSGRFDLDETVNKAIDIRV